MERDKCEWNIKQIVGDIEKAYFRHDAVALEHIQPFAELIRDDPDRAIASLFDVYNRALDEAYTDESGHNARAFIESFAGGPLETIPWTLYNAVGAVYPYLERPQKDRALGKLLEIWGGINYGYVNGARSTGHTPGIREPLLLADIGIVRPLYWPGLDEARMMLQRYPTFDELDRELLDKEGLFRPDCVQSDFQVSYGLLRCDFCIHGEEYVRRAQPLFLERTLRGIVGLRFGRKDADVKQGRTRLQELLPQSVHARIDTYRQEGGWVDYTKFP